MVVFLAATMIVAASAAVPNLLIQGQREKEEELIWRGEQYVRAVRLYYRKYGRFPQSLEELHKPKNQLRFLRKAYAEPMNRKDGRWRLIYVTPAGQLIGSISRKTLMKLPGAQQPAGASGPAGHLVEQLTPGTSRPAPPPGESGEQQPIPEARPPRPASQPAPLTPTRAEGEEKVFGGNIVGVASKIPKASVKVYKGATTYREWEFIWDPSADSVIVAQPGVAPAAPPAPVRSGEGRQQPPPTPPRQQ